jgi:hypothetical protein
LLFFPMWRQKGSNRQRNSSFTRFVPDPEFLDVHLSVVFCSVVPERPDRGGRSEAVIKCKVATFILVFSFHFSS